jgi:chitinase
MFKNDGEAIAMAEIVWAMFGPDKQNKTISRPFGSASVDGFDFDFEKPEATKYMVPFATRLRALMDAEKSRKFYMTAAPQCPFPDATLNEILEAVSFDMVFVQFYNTETCKGTSHFAFLVLLLLHGPILSKTRLMCQ